jgi:hypothetical protein
MSYMVYMKIYIIFYYFYYELFKINCVNIRFYLSESLGERLYSNF